MMTPAGTVKTVILCGGLGTRLSEETGSRPKPMVEIGGKPVLWHIMKLYAAYGFGEFALALGYKGEIIKDYFVNYRYRHTSLTVDLRTAAMEILDGHADEWRVHLVDTGAETQTGGRVRRLKPLLGNQTFMLTYGDGVAAIDLRDLLAFHRRHGKLATVTAVRPPARFGGLRFDGDLVTEFIEKPQIGEGWINGGFFVFEPQVLDYIAGDSTVLEREPLERLAAERQLVAYRHEGFWQCMDTLRDVRLLDSLWAEDKAPWKAW